MNLSGPEYEDHQSVDKVNNGTKNKYMESVHSLNSIQHINMTQAPSYQEDFRMEEEDKCAADDFQRTSKVVELEKDIEGEVQLGNVSQFHGEKLSYQRDSNDEDKIYDFFNIKISWLFLNQEQILSALCVSITQIPEVVTSSVITGVNPVMAFQGTWILNIVTSLVGGIVGMVSGSTLFVAVSLSQLVRNEGAEYIFYTIILGGILHIVFSLLRMGTLVRLIPYPVVQGFRNAMGIVIVLSQLYYAKELSNKIYQNDILSRNLFEVGYSWDHIVDSKGEWSHDTSLTLMAIYAAFSFSTTLLFPRFTCKIPSAFWSIVLCTIIEHCIIRQVSSYKSSTIGDYANIKTPFIQPIWTDSSITLPELNWKTLSKIYPYVFSIFGASLAETILTLQILNERTTFIVTPTNRAVFGQGLANVLSSCLGGMGGGATISQSIISHHYHAVTGCNTFLTGLFMFIGILYAHTVIEIIPLGTIGGIMFWAAFQLFDWMSILSIIASITPLTIRNRFQIDCKITRTDALIIISVMGLTACIDLGISILSAILLSVIVYAWDSSNRVIVERETCDEDISSVIYNVSGPLFFGTANNFVDIFPVDEIKFDPDQVILALENVDIFDSSAMVAVKEVYDRFVGVGKIVSISSLRPTSKKILEKNIHLWKGVSFLDLVGDDEILEDKEEKRETEEP